MASTTKTQRVSTHTHIKGLGLADDGTAAAMAAGFVGQETAREAAGIVVDMIRWDAGSTQKPHIEFDTRVPVCWLAASRRAGLPARTQGRHGCRAADALGQADSGWLACAVTVLHHCAAAALLQAEEVCGAGSADDGRPRHRKDGAGARDRAGAWNKGAERAWACPLPRCARERLTSGR